MSDRKFCVVQAGEAVCVDTFCKPSSMYPHINKAVVNVACFEVVLDSIMWISSEQLATAKLTLKAVPHGRCRDDLKRKVTRFDSYRALDVFIHRYVAPEPARSASTAWHGSSPNHPEVGQCR